MQTDNIGRLENLLTSILNDEKTTHGLARACRKLSKEATLYRNHTKGSKDLNKKMLSLDASKIQIGGGTHTLENYLNIDIVPPADIIYDVREKFPLSSKCSELIFCEHFLEHIDYPISVKKFAKECHRILKPFGKLIIGVPDSQLIVKRYLNKDKIFFNKMLKEWYSKRGCLGDFNTYIDLLNYHFRDQDDDDKYTPHMWSYDYEKLTSLFKMAGFKKVRRWRFNKSIANQKRKWGSIYVIATK